MGEYILAEAGTDATIGTFDGWPEARKAWEKIRDKRAVRLLCLWPCGCLRQAIRAPLVRRTYYGKTVGEKARHVGWRRIDVCEEHARKANSQIAGESAVPPLPK